MPNVLHKAMADLANMLYCSVRILPAPESIISNMNDKFVPGRTKMKGNSPKEPKEPKTMQSTALRNTFHSVRVCVFFFGYVRVIIVWWPYLAEATSVGKGM